MPDTIPYDEYQRVCEQLQASEYQKRQLELSHMKLEKAVKASQVKKDDPLAADVQELLDLWHEVVKGGNPNVMATLGSTRAVKVRATLKRRKNNGGKDICRKAILGIVHDDWAMGRIHKSQGKSFNDIAEHILNTDGDIEKWAEMYDRHASKVPALRVVQPTQQEMRVCPECSGTGKDIDTTPCFLCVGRGEISTEPEGFDRDALRWFFGEDCRLPYVPWSRDKWSRPPQEEEKKMSLLRLESENVELLRDCVSVIARSERRAA